MATRQSSTYNGWQRSFLFWISVFFVSFGSVVVVSTSSLQAQSSPLTIQPSTGKVGVGTTSPSARLEVSGSNPDDGSTRIRVTNTDAPRSFEFAAGITGVTGGGFSLRDATANAHRLVLDNSGNFGLGTTSPPSGGGPVLAFAQGSNPAGIGANTAGIYAKDVAGSAELFAFDEAGNFTQLSPHPADFLNSLPLSGRPFPWAYYSENVYLGKRIKIDLAGLVAAVELLTGQKFIFVEDLPPESRRSWDADQQERKVRVDQEIDAAKARSILISLPK